MDDYTNIKYLVDQLISSNNNAWSYFLKEYGRLIHSAINRTIYRYGYNSTPSDREDCFQEILRLLLEDKCRRLRKVCYFEEKIFCSYLYTVAKNLIINFFNRRKLLLQLPEETMNIIVSKDDPPDTETFRKQLKDLIKRLEDRKMRLVLLYFLDGMTLCEISELMNIPISTLNDMKQKGISGLRGFFNIEHMPGNASVN